MAVEWRFSYLADPMARLVAVSERWFFPWFKALADGEVHCLHCGQAVNVCDGRQAVFAGACETEKKGGGRQEVVITVCSDCVGPEAGFEDEAARAVEAAEAGMLTGGRSFKVGGVAKGPETEQ